MSDITDFTPQFTPVEEREGCWFKRDDLYSIAGVQGGKARTCWNLAQGKKIIIAALSRQSPQFTTLAGIAKTMGIPCRIHTANGALSAEAKLAQEMGAEIVQHSMGWGSVLAKRAKDDAANRKETMLPFGMECEETILLTARQVGNIPFDKIKRIVVPVGSGMTMIGILHGLKHYGRPGFPVAGVAVGSNPYERFKKYKDRYDDRNILVFKSSQDYHQPAPVTEYKGIKLEATYEAKTLPFLSDGDLLWIVGIRKTAV